MFCCATLPPLCQKWQVIAGVGTNNELDSPNAKV
jgi:hypothetical protein